MSPATLEKQATLTQERLRELLDYDPETGIFRWRASTGRKAGSEAGCLSHFGYRVIRINDQLYYAHRLIWLYVHGVWPSDQLDHINGVRLDNRLWNLREATNSENQGNRKVTRNGLKGAFFRKRNRNWQSKIVKNGKCHSLGCFDTELEAHLAYVAAALRLHGEFARAV